MKSPNVLPYTNPPTLDPPATFAGNVSSAKSFHSKHCRRRMLSSTSFLPICPPFPVCSPFPICLLINFPSPPSFSFSASGCRSAFRPTRVFFAFLPSMTCERMRRRVCGVVCVDSGMNWRSMVVLGYVRGFGGEMGPDWYYCNVVDMMR
jgi:hypothetical protein